MKHHGSMVAHIWANQRTNGETSAYGNGHIYFEGPTIYSYGRHFPIARHVEHKGRRAILFTTRTNSVTTGKHIGYVRHALEHSQVPVIYIHDLNDAALNMRDQFESERKRIVGLIARAKRPVPAKLRELDQLIDNANAYAEFYGLKWRMTVPADIQAEAAKHHEAARRRERANARRRVVEEENARRQWAIAAAEWKRGERDHLSHQAGTFLRIVGDEIETSHGARVPVEDARNAFPIVKEARGNGRVFSFVRPRLGHFAIDRIDADGTIHAGCHVIPWAEIERIAGQLGLIEPTAAFVPPDSPAAASI